MQVWWGPDGVWNRQNMEVRHTDDDAFWRETSCFLWRVMMHSPRFHVSHRNSLKLCCTSKKVNRRSTNSTVFYTLIYIQIFNQLNKLVLKLVSGHLKKEKYCFHIYGINLLNCTCFLSFKKKITFRNSLLKCYSVCVYIHTYKAQFSYSCALTDLWDNLHHSGWF